MSSDLKGLEGARAIYDEAVARIKPAAVVMAFSGGDDSNAAYQAAKAVGVRPDFVLHVNTRTGIRETTEFVRQYAEREGARYVEADAGSAYEDYVTRKGFFGRGEDAHKFAYHVLKAQWIRKAISKHIRKGRRNVPVLLLNGARVDESTNRRQKLGDSYITADPSAKSNHWVNLIHYWPKTDCLGFLREQRVRRNPVSELLHRSGECMCGTMQSDEARREAAFWFPAWGRWLDALERRVMERFPWGWGRTEPKSYAKERAGQMRLLPDFQPMCSTCVFNPANAEPVVSVKP